MQTLQHSKNDLGDFMPEDKGSDSSKMNPINGTLTIRKDLSQSPTRTFLTTDNDVEIQEELNTLK